MRAKLCLSAVSAVVLSSAILLGTPAHSSDNAGSCDLLRDGDYRIIDGNTPHGGALTAHYKLLASTDAQTGKRVYEAIFNPDFVPEPGVPTDAIEQMRERFALCFDSLGAIPGPDNDLLKVRLPLPTDPGPLPAPVRIDVLSRAMPREERSNLWSVTSGCPLIVHETMHQLGLVDLYPETQLGFSVDAAGKWNSTNWGAQFPSYDCRSTVANGSVMTVKMIEIVDASTPQYYEHTCNCETSKCQASLKALSSPPATCPQGAHPGLDDNPPIESEYEIATNPQIASFFKANYAPMLQGKMVSSGWTYIWLTREASKLSSILYPAEFRAITQAGCESTNRLYYACSKNSYHTTLEHTPPEARNGQNAGCVQVPDECRDSRWLTE